MIFRTVLAIPATTIVYSWCCFGQSPATPAGAEAEVRQFLADVANTRLKPDRKELERFYADEFTATNAAGQVLDKAAVIAARHQASLAFSLTQWMR
jgi:hypothetical protein